MDFKRGKPFNRATLLGIRGNMLTRKHFVALAKILDEHRADPVLVRDIADYCGTENPHFDRGRFYCAAGLEDL